MKWNRKKYEDTRSTHWTSEHVLKATEHVLRAIEYVVWVTEPVARATMLLIILKSHWVWWKSHWSCSKSHWVCCKSHWTCFKSLWQSSKSHILRTCTGIVPTRSTYTCKNTKNGKNVPNFILLSESWTWSFAFGN